MEHSLIDCDNNSLNISHISIDIPKLSTSNNKTTISLTGKLKQFEIASMITYPVIFIISKRGTGKTTLIKNIMHTLHDNNKVDQYIVFNNIIYNDYSDTISTVYNYNATLCEKIITDCKQSSNNKSKMIIFDDTFSSNDQFCRSECFMDLILNARHYKIGIIISMQYPMPIISSIRTSNDYVFIGDNSNSISDHKRLYEYYGGLFPDFASFHEVLNNYTLNYNMICLVNKCTNTRNIIDSVTYYHVTKSVYYKLLPIFSYNNENYNDNNIVNKNDKIKLLENITDINNLIVMYIKNNNNDIININLLSKLIDHNKNITEIITKH